MCILTNNTVIRALSVPLPARFSHLEMCVNDVISGDIPLELFACCRPPSFDTNPDVAEVYGEFFRIIRMYHTCIDL